MKTKLIVQRPFPSHRDNLEMVIRNLIKQHPWKTVSVAVAYCTVSGARLLYEAVRKKCPDASFRWLLGLDDFITQPGAIEFCRSLPRAKVRLYSTRGTNSRFHPKIFMLHSNSRGLPASLLVGSANLTFAALSRNCEAVAVVDATTESDAQEIHDVFEKLWHLGRRPTDALIRQYEQNYLRYSKKRKVKKLPILMIKSKRRNREILKCDTAERDPSTAKVCWIEVGKNTAMGHELEFKAEQAIFFGCTPSGGRSKKLKFDVSSGQTIGLRMKYQKANSMWRLQMTRDVPEVAKGLRPLRNGRLGRSPFVAILTRTNQMDRFHLEFILVNSGKHNAIRAKSQRIGAIGSTTSREYGWY